jgi:hypothetical protein
MRRAGKVSRRDLIVAGGATLIAGATATAIPIGPSSGTISGDGLNVAGRVVTVTSSSDPAYFGAQLDALFPGLRQDSRFQPFAPLAFLITNSSTLNIHALSLSWAISTPSGVYQTLVPIYRNPNFVTLKGKKSFMTARFYLLQAGKSLLVTPFFSLSPEGFQAQPLSVWNKVRDSVGLNQFMSQEIQTATSVNMQVDAAIYEDWAFTGPDTANLAKQLRVRRNAEHDEALSALKLIRAGVAMDDVRASLAQDLTSEGAAGKALSTSNVYEQMYWQMRSHQAMVLLNDLGHNDADAFIEELTTLRNQPKTIIRRLAA